VKKADILVGLLILFISASVFVMTQKFVGKVYTGYGPDRFPRFLAFIWSILGIMLIINALRNKYLEEEMRITTFGLVRMSVVLALTIAALIAMNIIGFIPATMLYIFSIMSYLKERSWLGRCLTSVAVTVSVYLIFRYVMVIPLPEFSLFEL
jgi:putative tricarboxylic transport membrane protein